MKVGSLGDAFFRVPDSQHAAEVAANVSQHRAGQALEIGVVLAPRQVDNSESMLPPRSCALRPLNSWSSAPKAAI
jgi:hypothetical protein